MTFNLFQIQGSHSTGKTGKMVKSNSRQGKHRELKTSKAKSVAITIVVGKYSNPKLTNYRSSFGKLMPKVS